MSSSPIATASTTRSSASCSFPADGCVDGPARSLLAVIACGALAGHIRDIANRRGWPVQVHALPAALHNRPDRIAPAVAELAAELRTRGLRVAVGYADCGSYGAIDEVCARLGIDRLAGLHCYDVFGGAARVQQILARQPGTYLLTDYLVRSFRRTVLAGLGLDRHPELWPDYFGNYRRLVWLAQHRDPGLDAAAEQVAALFGLPLRVIDVGLGGLERELARLLPDAPSRQLDRSRIAATSAGMNSARSAMTA
jgi:Protein of unknown function (DUF1638)